MDGIYNLLSPGKNTSRDIQKMLIKVVGLKSAGLKHGTGRLRLKKRETATKAMIDTTAMLPKGALRAGMSEVGLDLNELAVEATDFLNSQSWCAEVNSIYYDRGFPKVAVFLANVEPRGDADSQVWVIVGDVPPLYLDCVDHRNGAEALAGYVLVFTWLIALYAKGEPLDDTPPLLARGSLTPLELSDELADNLRSKLVLIRNMIFELWSLEMQCDISDLDEETIGVIIEAERTHTAD